VNTITLPLRSPREIETAGLFVAELQRQGLRFTATAVTGFELVITTEGH
jgi:hypothetical protein